MAGKIQIKVINLPVTANLTLGVAKLKDISDSNQ